MQWDLTRLYNSFSDASFLEDFKDLESMTTQLIEWGSKLPADVDCACEVDAAEVISSYVSQMNALKLLSSKLHQFASLTLATESNHEAATGYYEKIGKVLKRQTEPNVKFQRWLSTMSETEYEGAVQGSPVNSKHQFFLNTMRSEASQLLSLEAEVVMARFKGNGSEAWSQFQGQITANMMVPLSIEGQPEALPLQSVRNLAFSATKEIRKAAFEAELAAYPTIAPFSAAALNAIKGEVIIETELRGFDSPLSRTLSDANMTRETLDAMLGAVIEFLPTIRSYQKKKAQLLGYKDALPFYEIHAPLHTDNTLYSYDVAKDMVISAFSTFSEDLKDFACDAFNGNWIDVAPKKGKRAGAFCSGIHGVKESRILLNFTGSLNNVITLAHELGHGYHGRQIFDETPLNGSYSMPVAETASIFCETILKQQLIASGTDDTMLGILDSSIQGYAQVIMDIYSRYLFETELFETRSNSALSVNQLNDIMARAQSAAYGDALDSSTYHPYMWVNKVHYYYPQRNFYNFPYTFGLLFAKGLFGIYREEGAEFVPKYRNLLKMTGQKSVEEVAKIMAIDVQKKAFWDSALSVIKTEIELFIEYADKLIYQRSK